MVRTYEADRIVYLPPKRADVLSSEWRRILAANPRRRAAFIVNTSDTIMCLAVGERPDASIAVPAGLERGIVIYPAGGAFNMTDDNLSIQAVYARHGGAGVKNVAAQETNGMEEEG